MHGPLVADAATSRWKSTWFPASCAVGGGQFGITLARAIRAWSVDLAEREQKILSGNVIQCSRRRRRRLSADFHAPNQAPISASVDGHECIQSKFDCRGLSAAREPSS